MPPPPPPAAGGEEGVSGGWRALAVILALALAFAAAVVIVLMVDYGDTPLCQDVRQTALGPAQDCYQDTPTQKAAVLILGWPGGVLAVLASISALFFAATGRLGRPMLYLTVAAVVLGGASLAIGNI